MVKLNPHNEVRADSFRPPALNTSHALNSHDPKCPKVSNSRFCVYLPGTTVYHNVWGAVNIKVKNNLLRMTFGKMKNLETDDSYTAVSTFFSQIWGMFNTHSTKSTINLAWPILGPN